MERDSVGQGSVPGSSTGRPHRTRHGHGVYYSYSNTQPPSRAWADSTYVWRGPAPPHGEARERRTGEGGGVQGGRSASKGKASESGRTPLARVGRMMMCLQPSTGERFRNVSRGWRQTGAEAACGSSPGEREGREPGAYRLIVWITTRSMSNGPRAMARRRSPWIQTGVRWSGMATEARIPPSGLRTHHSPPGPGGRPR
jgi:hypothetical protein